MVVRVHVHLKVRQLMVSRTLYQRFLGVAPAKVKPDQINFRPPFVPLNLVLTPAHRSQSPGGFVNHLGLEVDSAATVARHLARVQATGIPTRAQLKVNCCYANQSKFWVIDPTAWIGNSST